MKTIKIKIFSPKNLKFNTKRFQGIKKNKKKVEGTKGKKAKGFFAKPRQPRARFKRGGWCRGVAE